MPIIGHRGHRDPETYKKFIGQNNVIYEKGELSYVEEYDCWAALDGQYIYDRELAIKYAKELNRLINVFTFKRINKRRF